MGKYILSQTDGRVAIATLNRPEVLNALCVDLIDELITVLEAFDNDPQIRVIVLAGNEKAFAAGADISEMAEASPVDMYERNNLARWARIKRIRKPIIAAVSGFALGGGCELAMHCDIIIASETAKFGQPEVKLGIIPGCGGTQRLTRAIGKFRAMEIVLSGRFITAREAYDAGLVTRVVSREQFLGEALRLAREIAERPPMALKLAKEAVLKADEMSLSDALDYERKLLYTLFATEDQKEGMKAFMEKRRADFKGK